MKRAGWIFLLSVLLPVLALAALAMRAAQNERAFLERQQEESARAQVALIVSDAEAELAEMQREFMAIYREVDFTSRNAAAIERGCRQFKRSHSFVRLVFVLDRDGTILWTFAPQDGAPVVAPQQPAMVFSGVVNASGIGSLTVVLGSGGVTTGAAQFDLSRNPTAIGEALRILTQPSHPSVALMLSGSTLSFARHPANVTDALSKSGIRGGGIGSGFGNHAVQGSLFSNAGFMLADDAGAGGALVNNAGGNITRAAGGVAAFASGSISLAGQPANAGVGALIYRGRILPNNLATLTVGRIPLNADLDAQSAPQARTEEARELEAELKGHNKSDSSPQKSAEQPATPPQVARPSAPSFARPQTVQPTPPPDGPQLQDPQPQQAQHQQPQQQPSDEAARFRQREQGFLWNRDTITAYLRAEQSKPQLQPSSKLGAKPSPPAQLKDAVVPEEQSRWKELPAQPAAPAHRAGAEGPARDVNRQPAAAAMMKGSDLRNDIPQAQPADPVARAGAEKMAGDYAQLAVPVETKLQPQLPPKTETYNPPVIAVPASFQDFIALGQHYIPRVSDNKLSLLLYARDPDVPDRIVGCEVDLNELKSRLQRRLAARGWAADVCAAILDDKIRPVVLSLEQFAADLRRPLVSEPLSEALPHWEAAIYTTRPDRIASTAVWVSWTVGLSVLTCLAVILIGLLLVWREAARERRLAQQKADFVTNVTHELQTPLANIRLFSEMLGSGGAPPEKQNQYASVLVAETERLSRLINNVLDFAKSGKQRRQSYQMQWTDAGAFVGEIVEMQRPRLENNGFAVTTELPDASLTINADREALTLALLNLVSNAEKYCGERREIAAQARQAGTQIEIAVLDRGIGVPAAKREKIFEPFYRAHDLLNSGTSGTGLGLTLARRIARDHGGDLRYSPRDGGGSEFVMTLPLV